MSRRRYRIQPPPASAEYTLGEPFEFSSDDDLVNAGKPLPPAVELTPVGPVAPMFEFRPEDDKVHQEAETGNSATDARGSQSVQSIEQLCVIECLLGGPKTYSEIRRYLYMTGCDIPANTTVAVLAVLTREGLIEGDSPRGTFQLTARGKEVASRLPHAG